jgi:hypothetical protein
MNKGKPRFAYAAENGKVFLSSKKRLMNGFRDDHPTLRVERVPRHGELKAQH